MKKHLLIFILIALLSACTPTRPEPAPVKPTSPAIQETPPSDWWDDAIFYEIFVRSFYDSNADGIGDFNGIIAKLDYLEDLGINAIWLMPINPSPSYHGYDVINYYAVNHEYGTMDDFKHLLEEAHKRDMHIIIDLVLNHTSSQHPFFVDANNDPESPYRDWYLWEENYPGWGGSLWHEGNHGVYYALFWGGMPDLNYRNPEVTAQMDKVARYWLDEIGVDGFRLDAIKHLIEEGEITENTAATHEWLQHFYQSYKSENPETYVVGEVYGAGGTVASTYIEQMDHVFNFELASGFVNSANGGSNTGINSAFTLTLKDMPNGNYATFLTNHDQNRAMSLFYGDVGKAKAAASLMLTAPGTPFIYYGEEIGMLGKKPDEDIRLPMQWSGAENAGFSGSKPWRTGEAGDSDTNIAAQENDPDSLLSHYRALIALRKEYPALRTGEIEVLDPGTNALFAALRTQGDEKILVIVNLTDEPVSEYHLENIPDTLMDLNLLLPKDSSFDLAIPAYETLIFELKK
ncbi:MAG: DUF3459 domain-containing protein [Anaerolineae bacterium]|jgi:alpha-amylase|nr:DUF3459 domain-containing protein [Anaerolineae bacterium]MBT7072022.1 DUF3459 domain-containing protein [Anaerolineae bacterium]MBT7324018.1 DUF3459 domain-containing protein [Anaerolineae bacterium]